MAGRPWERYQQQAPAQAQAAPAPWTRYQQPDMAQRGDLLAPPVEPQPAYSGSILPFSRMPDGSVSFDSNAGFVGAIKRALTLPRDVMEGKIDPRSDEGIARTLEMGTIVSPVNPAVRAGDMILAPGAKSALEKVKPKPPTADELLKAGGKGFDDARNLGVEYSSDAVADVARRLQLELEQDGILAETAPKSFSIIDKLSSPPEGSTVRYQGLEAARKALQRAGKDFNNPTDQEAARRIREAFDRFVENPDPSSVPAANPAGLVEGEAQPLLDAAREAARLNREARGNYAAGKRSDLVTGAADRADLTSAAANSGRNLDNTIRQRAASILLDPRKSAGFSAEERAQLEEVVRGTKSINTLRSVSNLLGGGGGLGGSVTAALGATAAATSGGGFTGGLAAGVALPVLGYGLKSLQNRASAKGINSMAETLRMRSPLYEKMVADAPYDRQVNDARLALVRAMLEGSVGGNPIGSDPNQVGPTRLKAALIKALSGQ